MAVFSMNRWTIIFVVFVSFCFCPNAKADLPVEFDYKRLDGYGELKTSNCALSSLILNPILESYFDGATGKVETFDRLYVYAYNTCEGGRIELFGEKKLKERDFSEAGDHLRKAVLVANNVKVCDQNRSCIQFSLILRLTAIKGSRPTGVPVITNLPGSISASTYIVQETKASGSIFLDERKYQLRQDGFSWLVGGHDTVFQIE